MKRGLILALSLLLVPLSSFGATVEGQRSLVLTEPPLGNAYLTGLDVSVDAPVYGDLTALGGSVIVRAPVEGDLLALGGTLDVEAPVRGDVRSVGPRVIINSSVDGDLVTVGGAVLISGRSQELQAVGATIRSTGGTVGKAAFYGTEVYLSGEYGGDVTVQASDRIVIGEGTIIHGKFKYNAPSEVSIPESAVIDGGATYVGGASYIPSSEEARTFDVIGTLVFFFVKALAMMVVAGLIVGLFPALSKKLVTLSLELRPKRFMLTASLGALLLVFTPLLILVLLVSFVGFGVALLLSALYMLLLLLSYVYAGFLLGAWIFRITKKRMSASWRVAVLGAFLLYVLSYVPLVGMSVAIVLMVVSAGVLSVTAYKFAFTRQP
jgi:hypothetical protein